MVNNSQNILFDKFGYTMVNHIIFLFVIKYILKIRVILLCLMIYKFINILFNFSSCCSKKYRYNNLFGHLKKLFYSFI